MWIAIKGGTLTRQAVDFDPDSLRKIMPAAVKVVATAMDAGKKCVASPPACWHSRIVPV